MKKILLMGLFLTGCQFNYTFPETNPHKDSSIEHTGYHGAHGCAYKASMDACLLARDLTDEEIDEAPPYDGEGYKQSQWCGENPDMIEVVAQQVFQCEDGTIIILEDDGTITEV